LNEDVFTGAPELGHHAVLCLRWHQVTEVPQWTI